MIRHLRSVNRIGDAIKPIVTGFDADNPQSSDPILLLEAAGHPASDLDRICRWRFKAPLAPAMAARREGHPVEFHALVDFSRRAVIGHRDMMFIEGIGGIMVPSTDHPCRRIRRCAAALPVAGSYVGTISHTLTAP